MVAMTALTGMRVENLMSENIKFRRTAAQPGYSLEFKNLRLEMSESEARALSRTMLEYLGLTVEHFNHDTDTQRWLFPELTDPNEGVRPLSEDEQFSHKLFWDALYGVSYPEQWNIRTSISATTLTRRISHPLYSRVIVNIISNGKIYIAVGASGQPSVDIPISTLAKILEESNV